MKRLYIWPVAPDSTATCYGYRYLCDAWPHRRATYLVRLTSPRRMGKNTLRCSVCVKRQAEEEGRQLYVIESVDTWRPINTPGEENTP